jgi:IS5 family transposase
LLTLLRGLLLGIWYKLSDEELASSLARDLLFRRFCRLELSADIPDATTLGRFRQQLVEHDLWEKLLGEVNQQLEDQQVIMAQGRVNIIDATPVEAVQSGPGKGVDGNPTKDAEAGWHVKQVTPGNVHDSRERDTLLLGDESPLYADAAYSSAETQEKLARFGIDDRVQRKGYRNHPLSVPDHQRNKEIAVTRSGGERPFATYKRLYGLARTRFVGLDKNLTFYGLAAMASNIRKGAKFLTLYGIREPAATG